MARFVRAGSSLLSIASIRRVDTSSLERLEVTVHHEGGSVVARNGDAIELVLAVCPSALEGRRLRFARRAWAVHNLIGHPLMQVAALLGLPHAGLWLHEITVPKPHCR